ncbi:MAG TPA: PAS domain S-box protein, partial [Archangium sp.]
MTATPACDLMGDVHCPPLGAEDLCRLADLSFDGMAAHRDGRIVWANRAAARLLGVVDAEELLGSSITDFIPRTLERGITDEIAISFARGEPSVSQFPVLRRNGEVFQAEIHRHPSPEGWMLVVFRDLEGRLQSQREQRSAELRARAFFDATGEAMGMSRMGRHLEVNRAYARLFGYDEPRELAGRPFLEVIAPQDQARVAEIKRRRACGEPAPELYTVTGRRKDGTLIPLEIRISTYLDIDDVVTIITALDLTEQQAEEA